MHPIYDTDHHFKIDPVTRTLTNELFRKTSLIQGDHNSERFTFELPKEIEGHDMTKCNVVQVHFNNIDATTKEQSKGFNDVLDLQPSTEDPNILVCSWLIPKKATTFVGSLHFVLRFSCVDENSKVKYVWNTAVYSNILIANGICNDEAAIEEYTDILAEWKASMEAELQANQLVSLEQTQTSDVSGGLNVWTATYGDGRTTDLAVRNGGTGLIGSIETIEGAPLHFSVTTKEKSEQRTNKKNLFEIVTDGVAHLSPVYRPSYSGSYGESLVVPVETDEAVVLEDGAEILVSPDRQGHYNPDGSLPSLSVGNTGEYPVDNGEYDGIEYGYEFWKRNDILRFEFDATNQKWLLTENLTQGKVYQAAWKTYTSSDAIFEPGKTYQILVGYGARLLLNLSFTVPSGAVLNGSVILSRIRNFKYYSGGDVSSDFYFYLEGTPGGQAYTLTCDKVFEDADGNYHNTFDYSSDYQKYRQVK